MMGSAWMTAPSTRRTAARRREVARRVCAIALTCAALAAMSACQASTSSPHRAFAAPEDAVRALADAAKAGQVDALVLIFGPGGRELLDSSDPVTARRNREIFTAAIAEGWRLVDQRADGKLLVIGNEEWPFPVPLVKAAGGWRFDGAAGREEVIARRIGRNELSAIQVCRTYVVAQRVYARQPRDGKRAGLYARTFRSDPGRQNGLYWPAAPGRRRSPLGDLLAEAGDVRRVHAVDDRRPAPFYGYHFAILTAQGPAASGGARDYVGGGDMSAGFALVAWPARYDVTGVMTFIVNADGIVHEKDLGAHTAAAAPAMALYDPDGSWARVQ